MPQSSSRIRGGRRVVGLAFVAFDLWRRLPRKRRRQLVALARKHGPALTKRALAGRRGRR